MRHAAILHTDSCGHFLKHEGDVMTRLSLRAAGFTLAAAGLVAGAVGLFALSGAAAAKKAGPPKTVIGALMKTRSGTLKPGSKVKASRVGSPRMFFNSAKGFGMARVGRAEYPVATSNGGKTWKTNGPYLHLDAAQAPLAVSNIGVGNQKTMFACCGGQVVDATGDGGKHWYQALLGDTVLSVIAPGNGKRLVAVAQNGSNKATNLVYVSTDGGHHWKLNTKVGAF
jgi:hypothetical protein